MPTFISSLITELRRNTRLRVGVWAIVTILLTYTVMVINDYHKQLKKDYDKALASLNQLQSIAQQTQWAERASGAQELRTQLAARLWQANTKGLAQAMFQTWIQEEIFFAKVEKPILVVGDAMDVPKYPQFWRVTAKLTGAFVPKRLFALLAEIAKNPRLAVTERLDIRHHQKRPKFIMVVSAYFKAPGGKD